MPLEVRQPVALRHVAAEEQARRPLEEGAVPAGVPAREHDLEPALAELERVAVTQDEVDGKVAAAHRHDPVPLGVEREGAGEVVPEVVPLAFDRLDPDDVLERRRDLERGVPRKPGCPPM